MSAKEISLKKLIFLIKKDVMRMNYVEEVCPFLDNKRPSESAHTQLVKKRENGNYGIRFSLFGIMYDCMLLDKSGMVLCIVFDRLSACQIVSTL